MRLEGVYTGDRPTIMQSGLLAQNAHLARRRHSAHAQPTRIEVSQRGLEPASPRAQLASRGRRAAVRGRKVEVLRFAPSMAQTLVARAERLDPAQRDLRPTRRAYLHVGAQASNERLGGSCARAAPRQAGVRPIQRLDSGPPAPLSQPHSGSRSCARRSQRREAEAADSARGPRGDQTARETGRGERAARRRSSSERSIPSMTAPPSHS